MALLLILTQCSEDNLETAPTLPQPDETKGLLLEKSGKQCFVYGKTHQLAPGDRFVFAVIPPGMEQPIPAFYYEELTDLTATAPSGQVVNLNSLGNLGEPPFMYFAYKQDRLMNIWYFGSVIPNPFEPGAYFYQEWVTQPSIGFSLNYPGTYFVGRKWRSKFQTSTPDGTVTADVNIEYTVIDFEKVNIGIGELDAFKIEGVNKNTGELDSYSWWSPELGINIKKLSYGERPGYELFEYSFAVGR
ncbi:MAG: hypothetical protein HC896_08785 [Bacteroidales bacterium]|nr:hypothetical protein [Bacteroidales bacterium]